MIARDRCEESNSKSQFVPCDLTECSDYSSRLLLQGYYSNFWDSNRGHCFQDSGTCFELERLSFLLCSGSSELFQLGKPSAQIFPNNYSREIQLNLHAGINGKGTLAS